MKVCNKCGEEKSKSDFNKNHLTRDGLQTFCRLCTQRYQKKKYKQSVPTYRTFGTKAKCYKDYWEEMKKKDKNFLNN